VRQLLRNFVCQVGELGDIREQSLDNEDASFVETLVEEQLQRDPFLGGGRARR
jgi:hypothetical protein